MSKRSLIALPGLFVILALVLGAWTSVPASASKLTFLQTQQPTVTQVPGNLGISVLTGAPSQVPGLQAAYTKVNSFKLRTSTVSRSVGRNDKMFVEDALATNTEEIAVLNYALTRVTNPDLKNLIQFMLNEHSQGQNQMIALNQRVNRRSSVDLTKSSVYPNTADYLLGIRTENLNAKYLDRLTGFSGNSAANSAFYSGADFDMAALDVLMELHGADLQSEISASQLVKNSQLKAFARNGAAMTEMHIKLMDALHDQLFVGIQPESSFEKDQSGTGGGVSPTVMPGGNPTAEPSVEPSMVPTSAP